MAENNNEERENKIEVQKYIFNNDWIKNIALAGILEKNDEFGPFGRKIAGKNYNNSAIKVPEQKTYELMFGEGILGDGAITKESLKKNARIFWGESLKYQTVEDITKSVGYEGPINEGYNEKILEDLPKEISDEIMQRYVTFELYDQMKSGISEGQKEIASGLERILSSDEK